MTRSQKSCTGRNAVRHAAEPARLLAESMAFRCLVHALVRSLDRDEAVFIREPSLKVVSRLWSIFLITPKRVSLRTLLSLRSANSHVPQSTVSRVGRRHAVRVRTNRDSQRNWMRRRPSGQSPPARALVKRGSAASGGRALEQRAQPERPAVEERPSLLGWASFKLWERHGRAHPPITHRIHLDG